MLKSRFEYAILMLVVALLGGAWIVHSRNDTVSPEDFVRTEAPIVGHLAPDFTLTTTMGDSLALSEIVDRDGDAGRPVILNYWASWCGPCRIETPHLQRTSLEYGNQVAILGINQGESASTITEFGLEFGLTYPLLVDFDSSVSQAYRVSGLPTTIFIDARGVVREVFVGILNEAVIEDRIRGLLVDGDSST